MNATHNRKQTPVEQRCCAGGLCQPCSSSRLSSLGVDAGSLHTLLHGLPSCCDTAAQTLRSFPQAASIYLWMVALGSLLYVIVAAYSPGSRPANVDKCSLLILCSWLGPTAHLLLLRLLPRAVYVRNRTRIILLLRVFYIGATSVNGFGLCGVAPIQDKKATVVAALQMPLPLLQQQQAAAAATAQGLGAGSPAHSPAGGGCSQESPFSALFWRSGVIGLNWWSAAFPLPFAHHIPVQAASVALYVNTLAHAVCSTMHGVRSGGRVLATIHHWARALSSQLMAAVGAAGPSTRYTAAAAMAAAAAEPAAGVNSGSSCVQVLAFVQLVLGMLLPAFVMYHLEVRGWLGVLWDGG